MNLLRILWTQSCHLSKTKQKYAQVCKTICNTIVFSNTRVEHNKISWKEASVNNSTIEVEAIYDHIRQIVNYSHKDKYNPQNGLRAYDIKTEKCRNNKN